jgi:hypothetical protein
LNCVGHSGLEPEANGLRVLEADFDGTDDANPSGETMYLPAAKSPVPGLSQAPTPPTPLPNDASRAIREALKAATEAGEWAAVAELARVLAGSAPKQ